MGRLSGIHADRMVRALERAGWIVVRSKGSHHVLAKPGRAGIITVPVHKGRTMKEPTAKGILRSAGLSEADFFALYR